jgi:hypothetical protein
VLKNKEVSKIKEVIGIEDPMQSADIIVPQPENLEGFIKQHYFSLFDLLSSFIEHFFFR